MNAPGHDGGFLGRRSSFVLCSVYLDTINEREVESETTPDCSLLVCLTFPTAARRRADPDLFHFGGTRQDRAAVHASTLIEAGGKVIYLDPAKPAKFSEHPKADLILITDIHGDHMDPDSIKVISQPTTEIIAPPAVVQTVTSAKPIANGETRTWGAWTIEAIPAYNVKRGPAPGRAFMTRGAATAMSSLMAADAFTSQGIQKASLRCARSRTLTWRSCA